MIDLVLSRYDEDISWLNVFQFSPFVNVDRIIIYNKGALHVDLNLGNVHVIECENVGREADSYVSHIIQNYDHLADVTIFAQAMPFDHCPCFLNLFREQVSIASLQAALFDFYRTDDYFMKNFVPIGQFFNFSLDKITTFDFKNIHNAFDVFKIFFGSMKIPKEFSHTWGAQFAISNSLLHRYSLAQYEALEDYILSEITVAWCLEKFWQYIFTVSQEEYELADKTSMPLF